MGRGERSFPQKMKRVLIFCVALMMALSLCAVSLGEETGTRRVFRKGEVPDFAPEEQLLELYVCPLLGADAMVMTCGGEIMLVDVGKLNQDGEIVKILDRLGTRRVDAVFNSHPHSDHIGSLPNLVKSVEIGCLYTAFPEDYTGENVVQRTAMKTAAEKGIPVIHVENGTSLTLGEAQIDCIQQLEYTGTNDCTCLLHVRFGDCTLLLTGDVDVNGMGYLARTIDPERLRSDIMKVPHHGLARIQENFLDAVQPEYAFVPHGILNSMVGRELLDRRGIPYSFATWGVIHLSTNGEYWIVDHELTEDGKHHQQKYGEKYW